MCAYRIGGAGREEIPFANSQFRDIGCPIILLVALLSLGFPFWHSFISSLLVLGFIRTYHDYTGKDQMSLHGLFIGLSLLPLAMVGAGFLTIVAYSAILGSTMGFVNFVCNKWSVPHSVWIEECFRGFIIIAGLYIF